MDIRDFLSVMRLLKAFYLDWPFNFDDKFQIETWYMYLQKLTFEQLKKAVNLYISKNDKGPSNPGDLLMAHAELELKAMIDEGEE